MKARRTQRLTESRALEILQLRYGTQIQTVCKDKQGFKINQYKDDSTIWTCAKGETDFFTREEILQYEDEMYSQFGA